MTEKINEKLLSERYSVRRLTADDTAAIYELCRKNTIFYEYHPPFVTPDSIAEDMNALPPSKTFEDKYFVGFYDGETLVAVMDLIAGYPQDDTAFIGFFMTDVSVQGKGVGSGIISECISYLKKCGFARIRLGVDKGNPQSFHFWSKNQFITDSSCAGEYIVMEREI